MKTELLNPGFADTLDTASLKNLVDVLTSSLEPAANNRKSFILNDIPGDIILDADQDLLASVLGGLVKEVIKHTQNGCIRITAKLFNNVVLLHIKNDGSLNYDSFSHNIGKLQRQAERLGGFVGFTSFRNKITTIAFSFMNKKSLINETAIASEEELVCS